MIATFHATYLLSGRAIVRVLKFNIQRLEQATLLAIHCAAQEKHNDEPIPREEMAARAKILAKAGA